ncbi:MAG: EAL domain-containing protein [Cellvibrionaceae bacterium]|nr:EAL domain-containing protein [Cellvibrionaceae bacterium]
MLGSNCSIRYLFRSYACRRYTSNIVGVEMLMRWKKSGQIVSPCEFIPIAEELGLIKAMTDKVLDKALKNLVAWRSVKNNFALAINISAPHFADSSLVDYVSRKLKQYNIPPSAIKLEVTEGAFIGDPDRAVKTMQELSELGVKLALDDFGTGYSSLAYLKKLPLDIVKIDRSFISGIGTEKADEAIIDATLVLAESLNVVCVAEGVEIRDQLDYLLAKNCTLIQGYYYYPPIEAEKVSQLLELKCIAEA